MPQGIDATDVNPRSAGDGSLIKAVLFDMDGLLIDSMWVWRDSVKKVMEEIGAGYTEGMWEQVRGRRVDEIVSFWSYERPWEGPSEKEVEEWIIENAIRLITEEAQPKKGVGYILDYFDGKGMTKALVSASYEPVIEAVVAKLGIKDRFDLIYSAENEEYGKPHPGVYLTAARKLSLPVEGCLVFEDSLPGIIAAKAARMKCVAIPEGKLETDCRVKLADLVLGSLEEFRDADWDKLNGRN